MLMQAVGKHAQEPETLKRHREMYEERLKSLRLTQGKSEKEVTERANNPRVYKTDSDTSNGDESTSIEE
ncbi:MAG: hypothetical protein LAO19_20060 [Acidobacteriia bacterium]|nr:hypothetical protein [Terriglobia bacterium]